MSESYEELFELFYQTYQEYLEERKSYSEALEITMDDFELIMNSSMLEKSIVLVAYGEIKL